jgi:hypothetical protein
VRPSRPLDSRFALFGIVIDGTEKKALVTNLNKKTPTEKTHIWVEVGDTIGNLNIAEIKPGQVTLTEGSSTHIVRLSEQNYAQRRPSGRTAKKQAGTGVIEIKRERVKSPAADPPKK